MNNVQPWQRLGAAADRESLQPDLARAIRSTLAYMIPVLLAFSGWLTLPVSFVAIAGQNVAMIDVRGDYRVRLGLLLAMTGVFAGAAALGAWAAPSLPAAIGATIFVAACTGVWRHLSSDYGMGLGISSTLVFLLALNAPDHASLGPMTVAAAAGGAWGLLLQVAHWPLRPQHPLRRPVADSWLALADVFETILPSDPARLAGHEARLAPQENLLRTTLEKTSATLAAARPGPVRAHLEAIHLLAGRLATYQVVLNTAMESVATGPRFGSLAPALQPLFTALKNTARTVALTVVSGQPGHLATAEVRARRVLALLRGAQALLAGAPEATDAENYLAEVLRQLEGFLPTMLETLRATVARAGERAAFSLELFDLETWTLRPLASALNLTWRVDPALVRFVLRLAVLMVAGVIVYKQGSLPHGYWLPFTVIVVLQPDYGSTRQRAAQRVLGTITGSICASALLWLHLPRPVLALAAAITVFLFGYLVKRNYAQAVFWVTLFIVILTEANGAITLGFTLERIASTLAGGGLALAAALYFWPIWERARLPQIVAGALQANRDYLGAVVPWLTAGGALPAPALDAARRRAESANALAFSSLQRMTGDPRSQRSGWELAATIANGNQRLTRALTVLVDQAGPGPALPAGPLEAFRAQAAAALDAVAAEITAAPDAAARRRAGPAAARGTPPLAAAADPARSTFIAAQLTRFQAELAALVLAVATESAPPPPVAPAPPAGAALARG